MNKHHAIRSVAALAILTACSQPASHIPDGADQVFDIRTGTSLTDRQAAKAEGFYGTIQEPGQFISFVRYNPDAFQTTIVMAEGEQADSTSALCLKTNAVAGINGSYFDMEELTSATFVKDDGFITATTAPEELFRTNGSLVLNPETLRIDKSDTTEVFDLDWEVLSAGPLLLYDNQVQTYGQDVPEWESFYGKRHPRSLIGYDADGGVWLVVVDGRSPGNAEGMTIAELTGLAQRLGLTNALNLDGGGSSTLWVLPEGVINHPSDNGSFDHAGERIVPNAIVVR